jgi:hypothetical protein
MQIIASLDRYAVFRLLNRIFRNHVKAPASPYSSVALDNCAVRAPLVPGDEVPAGQDLQAPPSFREDVVTQNQLTLVTVVLPEQVDRVRAVMAAIDAYARRLSPRGSLIGISTIHFVRWVLIDNDRRLMLSATTTGRGKVISMSSPSRSCPDWMRSGEPRTDILRTARKTCRPSNGSSASSAV